LLAIPVASFGGVFVSVSIAPPLLPVYAQPVCPGEGYIWAPGYWAYGAYGYYWVPGSWVLAPFTGALWTPGYWGWGDGVYRWHEGYWGLSVGFYGGINYGFGYTGFGYYGGYWNHGAFYYNGAVTHVDRAIVHNVYSRAVTSNGGINRVSFNGGRGGTTARPTAAQLAATRGRHDSPTAAQNQLRNTASTNRAQLATSARPSSAHATPPSRNHVAAPHYRVSTQHAVAPHRSAQVRRATPTPSRYTSRSSPAPHTSATRNRAPVQHAATRSQHTVQPHASASTSERSASCRS